MRADRVVRAGDHLVARPSGPASTSKYLSPAMPILIGTNSALPVAHDEHPFRFLARLPGLQFCGRGDRLDRSAARFVGVLRRSFTT